MRLEIPECRRCCCCVPLRHGVLVFGYLNLIFSIFIVVLEIVLAFKGEFTYHTMVMFRGVHFYIHVWLASLLYGAEIVFNIILLVGAHMKKTKLMRAYYYYGLATTLASVLMFFVFWLNDTISCTSCNWSAHYVFLVSFVLTGTGIQAYLLLLIRSELMKIKRNSHLTFVNHISERVVETPIQAGHNPFVFSIFIVVLQIVLAFKGEYTYHTMVMFRGVHFYIHVWFASLLYGAEIVFNIVLLVGAHMKKTKLMRAYYYYGLATTLASVLTFFVLWLNATISCPSCWSSSHYIFLVGFVLSGAGIQAYLLLLIRSELMKIKRNSHLCFVNHISEMVVETPIQAGQNPF